VQASAVDGKSIEYALTLVLASPEFMSPENIAAMRWSTHGENANRTRASKRTFDSLPQRFWHHHEDSALVFFSGDRVFSMTAEAVGVSAALITLSFALSFLDPHQ